MRPYSPPALRTLKAQVDQRWPDRARGRDGWIGDAAHLARGGQHSPDADGTVDALDLTHDPAHGFDAHALVQRIVDSRDPRFRRAISNGRIISGAAGPHPWTWRTYGGTDPHRLHAHIETVDGPLAHDTRPWAVEPATEEDPDMFDATRDRKQLDETRHLVGLIADAIPTILAAIREDDAALDRLAGALDEALTAARPDLDERELARELLAQLAAQTTGAP